MAPLLLRGGRVVDPAVGLDGVMDVLGKGGRIEALGKDLDVPAGATGVECEETSVSGTRAAAHGGFTTIVSMPNTDPVTDEGAAVRFIVDRAAEHGVVR